MNSERRVKMNNDDHTALELKVLRLEARHDEIMEYIVDRLDENITDGYLPDMFLILTND